jgi:hypothetical protein
MMWRVAIVKSVLALIVAGSLFAAFLFWLSATWFLDDAVAFRLSDSGWAFHAMARAGASCFGGTLIALQAYVLIRLTKRIVGVPLSGHEGRQSIAAGAIPVIAGLVGSVQFALTRPYL